jgi:hypothetical protein
MLGYSFVPYYPKGQAGRKALGCRESTGHLQPLYQPEERTETKLQSGFPIPLGLTIPMLDRMALCGPPDATGDGVEMVPARF